MKREIAGYQAACLYALVKPYDWEGAKILEIGTAWGYSAAMMAEAAPLAQIITLNPKSTEATVARSHLYHYPMVTVVEALSWDYLEMSRDQFDVIFVDGDHKNVVYDLPWWERLNPGGLFLFHDYSPDGTYRACPPVYLGVNAWMEETGLPFAVLVQDDGGVGLCGFQKPVLEQ